MLFVFVGIVLSETRLAIWKTTDLPEIARSAIRSWPGEPRVVTDAMCKALAVRYNCSAYNREDIFNIMRADACRYMALHEFGGVYADLDVQLLMPVPPCDGLCAGYESVTPALANYAIMAERGNSCLEKAINLCCTRLATVEMDFGADPHLVHNTCGPFAFTEASGSCADTMPNRELDRYFRHHVASATWAQYGYPSWLQERKRMAGWSHVYEH